MAKVDFFQVPKHDSKNLCFSREDSSSVHMNWMTKWVERYVKTWNIGKQVIRRRCNLSFNESHSLKTDDLETLRFPVKIWFHFCLVNVQRMRLSVVASAHMIVPVRVCSRESLAFASRQLWLQIVTLFMSSLDKQDKMFTRQVLFKSSNDAVAPPLKLHRVYLVWRHDEYSSLVLRQIVLVFMTWW
jgi:hypothetical protein